MEDCLKNGSASFALALHNSLCQGTKNIFLSPYSVYTSLCMVLNGAKGNTKSELKNSLGIGDEISISQLCEANLKLIEQINGCKEYVTLETASKVFPNVSYSLSDDFVESCRKFYLCDLISLDFGSKAQEAAETINRWVEDCTRNKIKDLLSTDAVEGAQMVLANAVYFKGNWINQFDPAKTEKEKFHIGFLRSASVDMMKTFTYQRYYRDENLKLKVLELPYWGDTLSMVIILPTTRFGLSSVMERLSGQQLIELAAKVRNYKVKIAVPKFRFEQKFELKNVLSKLGIEDMFSMKANLTGIAPDNGLYVSNVVHQTFIDVNEEGSEAAAATAVIGRAKGFGGKPKPLTFICDHPFFFMIYHKPTQTILFCGSYWKPTDG